MRDEFVDFKPINFGKQCVLKTLFGINGEITVINEFF